MKYTFDLFIELSATDAQAEFPVVYTNALTGQAGFPGRLPVSIPGLYPVGHRESAA